jgi:heat shock protein HslJ
MRMSSLAALSCALLAAVSTAAQSASETYRALGTEPFWSLTIDSRTIRYQPMEGRVVTMRTPQPVSGFNGRRYVTHAITVRIAHVECSDGMSDRTYRDTVTVNVGGRTLKGCGGEILSERPGEAASLLEGEWTIRSIGGRPVVARSQPRVSFQGNVISGTTGCNSFRGTHRFERGRLNAGPLATTRRGCMPELAQQEERLLALFGERLTVSRNRGGRLVLTGRSGQTLVLAPAPRR